MVWIHSSAFPSQLLKTHQATLPLDFSAVTALLSFPNGRARRPPFQVSETMPIFITTHTSARLSVFHFGGIFFGLHLL